MSFGKIQAAQFDLVRNSAFHAEQVKQFASKLSKGLNDLLNSDHPVEAWGTSSTLDDDGITLHIATPFGHARGVAVVQLSEGYIRARYIFEKVVASVSGDRVYRPVWAVRISGDGDVTAEDGALIYRAYSISPSERDNGVVTVALSAIYAIASDEGYYAAN